MIWAGLTDHLFCKTELFLDTRFSFFRFWYLQYLQIIQYISVTLEKLKTSRSNHFNLG